LLYSVLSFSAESAGQLPVCSWDLRLPSDTAALWQPDLGMGWNLGAVLKNTIKNSSEIHFWYINLLQYLARSLILALRTEPGGGVRVCVCEDGRKTGPGQHQAPLQLW